MAKKTTPFPYMTVLGIDMRRGALHYYNVLGDSVDSVAHTVQNFAGNAFDDEFFKKFNVALGKFVKNEISDEVRKIAFVVPDEVVALDNVKLPMLRSQKLVQTSLNAKLSEIYLNLDNLTVRTFQAEKNRQYCTYSVAAIQDRILRALYSACSENKLYADVLTYASASTVTALSVLNPKWKNENYLFLDVKDVYSRFIFVADGRCVGFYPLPFGLEFLSAPKYVQEDLLFDHSMAELTVLNASERAKAKKLSMRNEASAVSAASVAPVGDIAQSVNLDSMIAASNDWDDDDDEEELETVGKTQAEQEQEQEQEQAEPEPTENGLEMQISSNATASKAKVMAKKMPRKLPAFMQRPVPQTTEEIAKENFRVFVKWALSLIQNNPKLTAFGNPNFICVNLPKDMQYLIDNVNEDELENGFPFIRFDCADDNEDLARNLELFGGLYGNDWHSSAKF